MKKIASKKPSNSSSRSSKNTRAFLKQFTDTSHRYHLWEHGNCLLLAVSGGVDSMTLLDIFVRLQDKYALTLHVAHVNHGLRGKESEADMLLVQKTCLQYNIPFHTITLPGISKDEATLRTIRYSFFQDISKKVHADAIATAHHQDDQVETLLFRFLRGTGVAGLSGMSMKKNNFIRPLLFVPKTTLREYARQNHLVFHEDASNSTNDYARNWIRNALIPLLEEKSNPNLRRTLARTALLSADDNTLLEQITHERFHPKVTKKEISFSQKQWKQLPPSIQRRALRMTISLLLPENTYPKESSSIEEMRKMLLLGKPKRQIMRFHGLIFERTNDTVRLFFP